MITIQNEKFANQYALLFSKANDLLKYTKEDSDYINSLDKYFTKLGTIVKTMTDEITEGKRKTFDESFFLIPFDEPMFEINGDTRDIMIPDVFKKGVAVQGDHASEALVFCIDRYFDYKDLGSSNITIYIQYTRPDGKENMYQVGYKDLETYPGKVRFGWLLSDIATDAAGILKFSVRFITNDKDGKVYSLNTKTQTVTIYPALQKGILESSDGLAADSAFYRFVRDSLAVGETPAQQPRFDDPEARNLPVTTNLGQNNTLVLSAQATKGDLGNLTYTWRHEDLEGTIAELTNDDNYGIEYSYEEVVNPVEKPRVDYYEENGGEYEKYIIPSNGIPEDKELFEQYSTLIFKNTKAPIVGKYWVEAVNSLDDNNKSGAGKSITCTIPPLKVFETVKDLAYNEGKVIEEVAEEVAFLDETLTTTSYVAPVLEATYKTDLNAFYTYKLYKQNSFEDAPVTVKTEENCLVDANGDIKLSYTPAGEAAEDIKGIYFYDIAVTKNRYSKGTNRISVTSSEDACTRVTGLPEVPTFTEEVTDLYIYPEAVDKIYTLEAKVNHINDNVLTSDGYIYAWEIDFPDNVKDYKTLTGNEKYVISGHDAETIKVDGSKMDYQTIGFRCRVINTLNGHESESVVGQAYLLQKV